MGVDFVLFICLFSILLTPFFYPGSPPERMAMTEQSLAQPVQRNPFCDTDSHHASLILIYFPHSYTSFLSSFCLCFTHTISFHVSLTSSFTHSHTSVTVLYLFLSAPHLRVLVSFLPHTALLFRFLFSCIQTLIHTFHLFLLQLHLIACLPNTLYSKIRFSYAVFTTIHNPTHMISKSPRQDSYQHHLTNHIPSASNSCQMNMSVPVKTQGMPAFHKY